MITAIKIDEENFKAYSLVHEQEEENKGYLDNLSKINIFIGENNSGKSRFMREIFIKEKLLYKGTISNLVIQKIIIFIDELKKTIQNYKEIDDSFITTLKLDTKKILFMEGSEFSTKIKPYLTSITTAFSNLKSKSSIYYDESHLRSILSQAVDETDNNLGFMIRNSPSSRRMNIYIPMLRGLRTFQSNDDPYFWRTAKDYFSYINKEILLKNIFTGQDLYTSCGNLKNGGKDDRKKIKDFEKFLSESFFDGKDVELTANKDDNILHILIGEEEYAVSQIGDGIQSVIILTYKLFFNQGENMLFFFEEPEQCLHPAYQRVFMETLMRKEFDSFQYFFTTHSNHLLDITLDIDKVSIYTFKKTNDSMKNPTFEIENVDNENTDILRLIGVRNSSVFLSNCTIWVEGITDRIYIRKYLEVFQKTQNIKFLEDIHYSFVEYGGGNITHWSFLEDADPNHSNILVDRLCGKLFLITDKDGAGQKKDGTADEGSVEKKAKYDRHIKLKEKLGKKHYHCLEAREIENLLSTEVLKKVVLSYEDDKNEEFDFKEKFTYENYKNEKIGDFIDKNIIKSTRKGGYAAASGTIKGSKFEFSKRAVENIKEISDLSEEAKELTEKLYKFISEQNKK